MKKSNPVKSLIRLIAPFVIVAFIALVFILGIYGFYLEAGQDPDRDFDFQGALYAVINMFIMESGDAYIANWQLTFAKFGAAIVLGYGIFISIYKYIYKWWIVTNIKYFYTDHIVIFGIGSIGSKVAVELLEAKKKVVVLEKNEDNDNLDLIKELGGVVIIGNALEKDDQIRTGVGRASSCLILLGNDELNLESANMLSSLNQFGLLTRHLDAKIHVEDWYNNNFLKTYLDLYNKTPNLDIDPFNIYQSAAQMIFDKYSPVKYVTYEKVEKENGDIKIFSSDNSIAIIGYTETAEAFIAEAIILSHIPGLKNLRVFIINENAHKCVKHLRFKFPFIDEFLDIVPVELADENFASDLFSSKHFIEELKGIKMAYIFGENDTYLVDLANSFRQLLYAKLDDLDRVPIVVCLPEKSKILDLLDPADSSTHGVRIPLFETLRENFNFHMVGMFSDTATKAKLIDESEIVDALAKTINYFYSMKYEFEWLVNDEERKLITQDFLAKLEKKFLTIDFETTDPITELEDVIISDVAEVLNKKKKKIKEVFGINSRWNSIVDIKQDSNRYVARHLEVKVEFLKKMGHINDLSRSVIEKYFKVFAPIEHKRWCSEKLVYKFRYGKFPDDRNKKKLLKDVLKIHDQLIPYNDLDEEMEDKDFNMFLLMSILQKIKQIYIK